MSSLIKIFIIFLLIVFLTSKKTPLGISLLIGSIVMGFSFNFSIIMWKNLFFKTINNSTMWELTFTFLAISIFASSMKYSGVLDGLIQNMKNLVKSNNAIMALIPIIIGMLNIPGGAYISAPFVNSVADSKFNVEQKSAVNIIYRHIWYPIYPLFPALILAQELAQVSLKRLLFLGIPSSIVGLIVSWWVCFGKINPLEKEDYSNVDSGKVSINYITNLFLLSSSLLVIILLVGIFEVNIIAAIIIGTILLIPRFNWQNVSRLIQIKNIITSITWQILLVPAGIYSFRASIEISGIIEYLLYLLNSHDLSAVVLSFILSIIIAFITGYHLTAVGIIIPMFLPLISPESHEVVTFIIFMGTLFGYWISPIHTCMVLSNDYFKANYLNTLKIFIVPASASLLTAIITSLLVGYLI